MSSAASGNLPFAKEMLNFKPSFARKLNTKGMIWLDGGLARVKGRNSITPFHLLALKGNADLVARSLRKSPECIQDESVDRQNALHLAVMHDRFDVLQVLTGWIQRMSQRDADSIESRVLPSDASAIALGKLPSKHIEEKAGTRQSTRMSVSSPHDPLIGLHLLEAGGRSGKWL
ncbi:hypothetical protein HID58_021517 [Brassica napus]|uniref:ANK_REP_REGION domain-containing protein n=1 Tax=Brassica napus TaxID=3708 RepID=A0ABQ8CWT4_BRANA|nr:hypothetical protein HID58_021517 [Brassica napus]